MTDTYKLVLDASHERLRMALRPCVALVALTSHMMAFPGDVEDRIAVGDRVTHADASGPGQAEWSANTVRLVTALDADPDIRALRQRLFDAGFGTAFAGDHDDEALWTSLSIRGPREALVRLEELAADDAGITDADARAEASNRFIAYMLRNHHPAWQANRQHIPDVGDSPYTPREEWTLLGT